MKLTVDILDDFIKSLDLSGEVIASGDDGTNTVLTVGKTYHARKGMLLDVDGTNFKILSVVNNESIEVGGRNRFTYKVHRTKSFLLARHAHNDQQPYKRRQRGPKSPDGLFV